jgi:hypothetical protein
MTRFRQITFREALERLAQRAGVKLESLMEGGETLRAPGQTERAQGDELRGIATARFLPGRQAGERSAANGRRP